jgi:hypothetical protein
VGGIVEKRINKKPRGLTSTGANKGKRTMYNTQPAPQGQPNKIHSEHPDPQLNVGDALRIFAAHGTPKERAVATRILNDIAALNPKN